MGMISVEGLNATAGTMTAVAGLFTVGRFIIHWRKNRKLRWDDWFNAIAVFFLVADIIIFEIYVPIEYNAILYMKGLSNRPPTEHEAVRDMKLNIAGILFFFCTIYSVKASFLALYWQIFNLSKRFRIAWWSLTAYTVISLLVSIVTVFTRCGPAKDFVNMEVCSARPRTMFVGYLTLWCVLNVLGDLLLMILPMAMLKSLHMRITQKIGLAVVFVLVLAIIAMDILRTYYTLEMDLTEGQDANALWGILEPTIAVIVCALPCYRGLLGFSKGTTQNDTFWSFGRSSVWSRLFRTSHSSSGSATGDDKEKLDSRDTSKDGSFRNHSQV